MRILEPDSFGIFMKVLAIVGINEILVGLRLGGGVVQQKKVTDDELSTIFWINVLWSFLLGLIFYSTAGVVANFYNDVRVAELMQWSGLVVIIIGIGYVPNSILTKALDFKKIFVANLVAVLFSSSLGIYLAKIGFDYWSLFFLWSSYSVTLSILYLFLSRFKPSTTLNPRSISNIWKFSKKLLVNDLLNYSARNIDNIIVGRVIGDAALGVYSRAYNIMLIPIHNFVNVLNGVLFPSFSLIQDDTKRIKEIFGRAVPSILLITLPFILYVWVFSPELILAVFGSKWQDLEPILRVFLVLGMIQIQTILAGSIFMSQGRSDLPLKVSYISKPILILAMIFLVNSGILKLAMGVAMIGGFFSIVQLLIALRLINYNALSFIVDNASVWLVNLLIASVLALSKKWIGDPIGILYLAFALAVTIFSNLLYFELKKPAFYLDLKMIILAQISKE
jgi:O-antigen/teichoic acid export membrane protein